MRLFPLPMQQVGPLFLKPGSWFSLKTSQQSRACSGGDSLRAIKAVFFLLKWTCQRTTFTNGTRAESWKVHRLMTRSPMHKIAPHWLNYIEGKWVDSEADIAVLNPATAETVATIAKASLH